MFGNGPQLRPGDAAPVFELTSHTGDNFSLFKMRGKQRVVLMFRADGGVLTQEPSLQALEASIPAFEGLHTRVVSVGYNKRALQQQTADRLGLTFSLLSDPDGEVARLYGARRAWRLFRRKTFVIDGRGVIRLIQDGYPLIDSLLIYLEALRGDL